MGFSRIGRAIKKIVTPEAIVAATIGFATGGVGTAIAAGATTAANSASKDKAPKGAAPPSPLNPQQPGITAEAGTPARSEQIATEQRTDIGKVRRARRSRRRGATLLGNNSDSLGG